MATNRSDARLLETSESEQDGALQLERASMDLLADAERALDEILAGESVSMRELTSILSS